ncbi:MAG: hypothetical protein K9J13_17145 [Saprospiraceae bacterium]|nr:hypothetical protein [Saprospiraceae bacterium]
MAFYMDGSGMPTDDFNNIELKLKELKRKKEIEMIKIADLCLSVLYEIKKK